MIEIVEVKKAKDRREFVNFPIKLYKGNDCFVPPLYADEMKMFKPDYAYNDQADAVYYLAKQDGKTVGRISGILQKASNKKTGEKRVRFTRFDCIDSQEVATALFDAVERWAKSVGMEEVVGPLGFSDLEREGLLIDGFDEVATFEEQYNYPYYQKLIENCGYAKEVDWFEHKLRVPADGGARLKRLSEIVMQKYKLHFKTARNTSEFLKFYGDQFFEILDKTYVDIYGTVPFTPAMKKMLIANFKLIVRKEAVTILANDKDEVVCFAIGFASLARAMQKCNGHLTPLGIIRILHAVNKPEIIDLGLIGVLPEYKGAAAVILADMVEKMKSRNIKYAETNLNLETNTSILSLWKSMECERHKVRRCFVKSIKE